MNKRIKLATWVAAPVSGLVGVLILPPLGETGAERLASIEAHASRFLFGNLLLLLSFVLFVPALIMVARLLSERDCRWGHVAAIAAAAGYLLHLVIVGGLLVQYPLAMSPDRAVAGVLADDMFSGVSFLAVLLPMLLLTELGMLLTAIALWRARVAPPWVAVAMISALVADFVAPEPFDGLSYHALMVVGFLGLWAAQSRRGSWHGGDVAEQSGLVVSPPATL